MTQKVIIQAASTHSSRKFSSVRLAGPAVIFGEQDGMPFEFKIPAILGYHYFKEGY
jgi:hypothetical protein